MEEQSAATPSKDTLLPVSILVSAILISASLIYTTRQPQERVASPSDNEEPTAVEGVSDVGPRDVILGEEDAPVTLVEYGDYQCPFCARYFNDTAPLIRDAYVKSGKVKMMYRNFAFLGPESTEAAEAAECAKDQNKFWAYHDALYTAEAKDNREHNGNLNRGLFMNIAGDLKLDAKKFADCYDKNTYAAEVEKENEAAQLFGVRATPTSFVNGTMIQGAQEFPAFKVVIDGFLK